MDWHRKVPEQEQAMSNSSRDGCGGCGCVSLIIFLFLITALWWGLPTPWGTFNIDLFPPRIWQMDQPAKQ